MNRLEWLQEQLPFLKGPIQWATAEDWRTWLSHYLITLLVTLATAWWFIWIALVLVLVYLFLEGLDSWRDRNKWIDHSMDWATAWSGFGTAMFVLDGNLTGAVVLTIFIVALGIIAYTTKSHEV